MALGAVNRGQQDHIRSVEGRAAAPDGYASWDAYMQDVEEDARRESAYLRDAEYRQGMKAMRLAPNLEIYRALVNGENVPREHLDPTWVKRYRL